MKSLFLLLAILVAAQASILDMMRGKTEVKTGDKVYWTRQMNILKLFNHYTETNANTEQGNVAKNYNLETLVNKIEDQDAVKLFLLKWRDNSFLDKYEVFSITNKYHREDARLIVHLFLAFKDFDNFYEFACWTRDSMNQDMFLYTLTVAVLNRNDCQGMRLPALYEIVPNKFFNDKVIEIAKRIKMQGKIVDTKLMERMGVKKVNDRTFVINALYSCWFLNTNEECKLNYFTEDVSLNNKYFILNAMKPFWMYMRKNDTTNIRRGEYFLFMHQQLLNRYYMERLSNDLGEIPNFSYDLPIATGMTTTLKHFNGLIMPSRPNDFLVDTVENEWDIQSVEDYERRLRDIVQRGFVTLEDGKTLYVNKPEDIEILGNLIQSNTDCPNINFYTNGLLIAKKLLGNTVDTSDRMFAVPTILEQYETALRDPMFWQLWKRTINYVKMFKYNLKPYSKQDVSFHGVNITGIKTDKLETFFDTCNSDISNAVYRDEEETTKNHDKFTFVARQSCLNHHKFNVEIDYTSDKTTDAIVKIFLGPIFDGKGIKIDLGRKFLQIDNFVVNLKTGTNTIRRDSTKFWQGTRNSTISYTTMLKKIEKCMTSDCDIDTFDFKEGFPNRLVLPKGKVGGMTFKLFVSIAPIKKTKTFQQCKNMNNKENNDLCNDLFMDDNALGYPLDRQVDWTVFRECTNMKMTDVTIYHDIRTDNVRDDHTHINNLNKNVITNDNRDKDTGNTIEKRYSGSKVVIDRFGNQHVYNFGTKVDRDINKPDIDITVNKKDKDVTVNKNDKDITINKVDKDNLSNKPDIDITINKKDKDVTINKTDKNITINKVDKDNLVNKTNKDVTGNKVDKDITVNMVDKDFSITKTDKDYKITKVDKDRDFTMTKTNDEITIQSPYFTRTRHFNSNKKLDWSNSDESSEESKESKELSKEKKELSKERKMKKEELSEERKQQSKERKKISKESHI